MPELRGRWQAVSVADYIATLAHAAAAVSVVTRYVDGQPHGTTVSAFMSLSADPPMLLVSLANTSRLLDKLSLGAIVGVNVLSQPQSVLATRFSQKVDDKFAGTDWELIDGAPRLPGWHAWVTITVTEFVETGDHTLVLGTANTADFAENAPLVYWNRVFDTVRSLSDKRLT